MEEPGKRDRWRRPIIGRESGCAFANQPQPLWRSTRGRSLGERGTGFINYKHLWLLEICHKARKRCQSEEKVPATILVNCCKSMAYLQGTFSARKGVARKEEGWRGPIINDRLTAQGNRQTEERGTHAKMQFESLLIPVQSFDTDLPRTSGGLRIMERGRHPRRQRKVAYGWRADRKST